tara:strand:- start:1967 stop:3238 length:1272 start_codon:yes stop_codon:yes gene_type:complete
MKTLKSFLTEKGITEETFKGYSADEQAKLYNEMNEANTVAFQALQDDVNSTKESIATAQKGLIDTQTEQMKFMNKHLEEFGVKLKALEEGKRSSITSNKSVIEQLKDNKETLTAMAKGAKGSFTIKAAGDMALNVNVTGQVPQAERIVGLNTVASRQVRLLDIVSTGVIGSNLVEWVYQANKDGSAGATGEGLSKNQIDFDMVVGSQKVEKVTAYIKATTEMLSDVAWIEQEIRNELMRELLKAVESGAYSGSGVSPILNGYRTVSTAFAAGDFALAIDNANEVDVLVVADNQIKIANQPRANYILMHPTDVTKLKVAKITSTDKRYIDRLQMIGGSLMMDGIPIVETTLVAVGEYLIGNFEFAKLLTKEGVSINIGLDSDDWTKNFRTILAEWRGVAFIKNNDRTAFVKGVFATDKAALETA